MQLQTEKKLARVSHHILNGFSSIQELEDEEKFIRIDQDALEKLESNEGGSKDELQQLERDKFNSVGKQANLVKNSM